MVQVFDRGFVQDLIHHIVENIYSIVNQLIWLKKLDASRKTYIFPLPLLWPQNFSKN